MKKRFFTRLSAIQIKRLCAMAGQAFKAAKARGGIEEGMSQDDYRKAGQMEAAGIESLKEATQEHFLAIRGKWWTVIGNLEQAFYDFLNAGPEEQALKQMKWRLMGQLAHLAEAIATKANDAAANEALRAGETDHTGLVKVSAAEAAKQAWIYAQKIARDRFHGQGMESLAVDELEQHGFTIVNRANAMRGVGDSSRRNKSQGRAKTEPSQASEDAAPGHRGSLRAEPSEGLTLVGSAAARLAPSWGRH